MVAVDRQRNKMVTFTTGSSDKSHYVRLALDLEKKYHIRSYADYKIIEKHRHEIRKLSC
jgi:hypothetical protein